MGDDASRQAWVGLAQAYGQVNDQQAILQWAASEFGWSCDPGLIDGSYGPATTRACRAFQRQYNADVQAGLFGDAHGDVPIGVDGSIGAQTYGAMFDCLQRALRGSSNDGQASPAYIIVDDKHQTYPAELAQIAAPGGDESRWTDLNPLNPSMVRPDGGGWYGPQVGQRIYIPDSWDLRALGTSNGGAGYETVPGVPAHSPPDPVRSIPSPGPVSLGAGAHHLSTPFAGAPRRRGTQRAVEVVLFDDGELPAAVCTTSTPDPCKADQCELYDPREFQFDYLALDAAPVTIRVYDQATGNALASTRVSLLGPCRVGCTTDDDGLAVLAAAPGSYVVTADHPDYQQGQGTLNVAGSAAAKGNALGFVADDRAGGDDINQVAIPLMASSPKLIKTIKTIRLAFTSDHKVMKDNNSDWLDKGNLFPKPDFTYGKPSYPISHTKNKSLELNIDLEVWPVNADPVDVTVTGTATWDSTFQFVVKTTLKGGVNQKIELTSKDPLPDKVAKLAGNIHWTVSDGGTTWDAGDSFGHVIYVTAGTPIDSPAREQGITQKRMDAAVAQVAPAYDPSKPAPDAHAIAQLINSQFKFYSTKSYFVPDGAWPLIDPANVKNSGECQAIVRLVRGILLITGVPCSLQAVHVFADPDVGNGAVALEDDLETGLNLHSHRRQEFGDRLADPVLMDRYPGEAGSMLPNTDNGVNYFEACLKVTASGKTLYYPGGESGDTMAKNSDVILVFNSLIWVSRSDAGYRVEKIVKRWRDPQNKLLP